MWILRFLDLYLYISKLRSPTIIVIYIKGVVNCQNSQDKGPPEGNSAPG